MQARNMMLNIRKNSFTLLFPCAIKVTSIRPKLSYKTGSQECLQRFKYLMDSFVIFIAIFNHYLLKNNYNQNIQKSSLCKFFEAHCSWALKNLVTRTMLRSTLLQLHLKNVLIWIVVVEAVVLNIRILNNQYKRYAVLKEQFAKHK